MISYKERLANGTPPFKASKDNYMRGDYYLLHVLTLIANHHNTDSYRGWVNGVGHIARFGADKRSLDQDVIEYQFIQAQKLSRIAPIPTAHLVNDVDSALWAIDTEVHDDHPLMEGNKVILPCAIRYNMAAFAACAISTAVGYRMIGDTNKT